MTTSLTRNPAYTPALAPLLVTGWSTTRNGNNIFHNVINSAAVDVTLRPASLRTGTVTYLFATQAAALNAEAAHAAPGVFTMNDSGLNILLVYVVAGAITVSLDDDTRNAWTLSVDFQEVTG